MTAEPPARTPTIADVARAAEVSAAAVSYVLSGRSDHSKRVGEKTRQRIEAAVADLGYVPNQAARHLRRRRTDRICVVLFKLGNPFADRLALDIDAAARARGFSTVVTTAHDPAAWRRIVSEMESGLADAVVLDVETEVVEQAMIDDLVEPLKRSGRPVLMFHSSAVVEGVSVVRHERAAALQLALEHVHAQGHQRLGYVVNGEVATPNLRRELVEDFARRHNLTEPLIFSGASRRDVAVGAAETIAGMADRPTALLVESDFSAVAMIHTLQKRGLHVPNDIAVIGCGNAEEGQYCFPALTTIGPVELSLVEEATHLIERVGMADTVSPRDFRVPWQLFLRDSG